MSHTIFEQIINRTIPATVVYEDEETFAFLDHAPNNLGHTLVVPKHPVRDVFDADDRTLVAVMLTAKLIAHALKDGLAADGVNIYSNHGAAAGQVVFHLHLHVIPRYTGDYDGVAPRREYAPGEAETTAERIIASLPKGL
jgi:histidine triad (HIT) family protein